MDTTKNKCSNSLDFVYLPEHLQYLIPYKWIEFELKLEKCLRIKNVAQVIRSVMKMFRNIVGKMTEKL